MPDIGALRARANTLVGTRPAIAERAAALASPQASAARKAFSVFDADDLGRATALAGLMQVRARDAADTAQGLEAALILAETAADGGETELAAHAVRLFQAANNLVADGEVGPATFKALKIPVPAFAKKTAPL